MVSRRLRARTRRIRVTGVGVAVGVEVGHLFADYGAEVIKVETRHAPDFIRIIVSSYTLCIFGT